MSRIRDIIINPKKFEIPKQLIQNDAQKKYVLVQYPIVIGNVCLYIFKRKLYYDGKRSNKTLGEQLSEAKSYIPDLHNFKIKTKSSITENTTVYKWNGQAIEQRIDK